MNATDRETVKFFERVGGSAFPAKWNLPEGGSLDGPGMTLRDWFAGQALAGILTQRITDVNNLGYVYPSDKEPLCGAAYRFADAMLAERQKP